MKQGRKKYAKGQEMDTDLFESPISLLSRVGSGKSDNLKKKKEKS